MPPKRLLVVCESFGIGGTETHLIRLLPRLANHGWDVTAYCLHDRGCRAEQVEQSGVRVISPPRPTTRRRKPLQIALAAHRLFLYTLRWRPHIAHFYLPGPYIVGAPVAIAARTPIKIMSRRSQSHYQKNWTVAAQVERLLHPSMDAVIANSRAVARDLIREGIPKSKIRMIYNGIDASMVGPERAKARRSLGIQPDTLLGLMIANLIPYKGHVDLIEALATVAQNLPPGWRFLCAGRDEGIQTKLETSVAKRGLTSNLQFLGERTDIPTLLAASDFGVLSSWEEGFSNVILESMAAGLPMVVTHVGGNSEAVIDGKTGLVIPPRNPVSLGLAVLALANSEDLRCRLGEAARVRVREHFSIEKSIAAQEILYHELYERRLSRVHIGSSSRSL